MSLEGDDEGKTAFNERAKLTATYVNGMAIAVLTVGGFAPLVLALQDKPVDPGKAYFAVGCLLLSMALHLVGRGILRELRD